MSPTSIPKLIKPSKWQTDLLNTLYAKSPQPTRAQRTQISNETGLYVTASDPYSGITHICCAARDETWVKHWFQKRAASASSNKTNSPPPVSRMSTRIERKASGRSSSAPTSTSPPRVVVRPVDIYIHESPADWEVQTAPNSEDTFHYSSGYVQNRGSNSQSLQQPHNFPILFEPPQSHAYFQAQAPVQSSSMSISAYVFPTPSHSQHYSQASQKSRVMSPSLGYIPSAFPMSIFTDSPPQQSQNITPRPDAASDQSTSAQFVTPTPQDPYSIRFPLTYSPRRRNGSSSSFLGPHHQQSQSHTAYNLNYGYDTPSEASFSPSLQSQPTSGSTQHQSHPDSVPGSTPYNQTSYQTPIAYTARLADLTAFALNLKASKVLADAIAREDEDGKNGANTESSPDIGLPKSSDMDKQAVVSAVNKSEFMLSCLF